MAETRPRSHRNDVDGVHAFWVDGPGRASPAAVPCRPDRRAAHTRHHPSRRASRAARLGAEARARLERLGRADHNRLLGLRRSADVGAFLTEVTRQLHDLPLERLETERSILRAEEAAGRATRSESSPGAGSAPSASRSSTGSSSACGRSSERSRARAAQRFTRGNARSPAERPPAAGAAPAPARRLPHPASALREPPEQLPAFSRWGRGGVTLSLFAPRSSRSGSRGGGGAAGTPTASLRAWPDLRALGLDQPPNKHDAHVVFIVECTDENVDAVRAGLIEVLEEIATDGPTDEERKHSLRRIELDVADPPWRSASHTPTPSLLLDDERTLESDLIEMQSVTTADTAAAMRAGSEGTPPDPEEEPRSRRRLFGCSSPRRSSCASRVVSSLPEASRQARPRRPRNPRRRRLRLDAAGRKPDGRRVRRLRRAR